MSEAFIAGFAFCCAILAATHGDFLLSAACAIAAINFGYCAYMKDRPHE